MSTTMTIRLEDEVKDRLDRLADSTNRSKSYLAAEAIRAFVEINEWQVAEIRAAIKEADAGDFALIVNATSAARNGVYEMALPFSLSTPRTLAVDLNYGEAAIPFQAWARVAGCRDVTDGLGMLVEQAAASFELWHGLHPDTAPVYAALRDRDAALVSAD